MSENEFEVSDCSILTEVCFHNSLPFIKFKAKISPLEYGAKTKFPSTATLGSPIIAVVF